ncbi:MAG: hypothetical protein ACLQLE_03730 [Desulfobaccales bacterium]
MAFLKLFTVRPLNFLFILFITALFSGCVAGWPQLISQTGVAQIHYSDRTENVQVIHVDPDQIYGKQAVRVHFPDGRWVVYVTGDVDPEVLDWELHQIALGTVWDRI